MVVRQARVSRPGPLFAALSATVVVVAAVVLRTSLFARNPDVLAFGATLDLCLTLPIAYWLLVVRRGRAHPATIAAVFLSGLALSRVLVPDGYRQLLADLALLGAAAELVLVVAVAAAIRREIRRPLDLGAGGDPEDVIELGGSRLGRVVGTEMAILYAAATGWRREPSVPSGGEPVSGIRGEDRLWLLVGLIALILAETLALHLWIQRWSVTAAWTITLLDLYAVVWLIGDHYALCLRPHLVFSDRLFLRSGLRMTAQVPLESIVSLRAAVPDDLDRRVDHLNLGGPDGPEWVIELDRDVTVTSPFRRDRTVRSVGLRLDRPERLEAALDAVARRVARTGSTTESS